MALGEFSLIERYFTRTQPAVADLPLGIGDDAALVRVSPGHELAISVDTLVAGRHFPESTSPADIGYKSVAVNLSDMAAMGARPRWLTLAISLPDADETFLEGFSQGFMLLADRYDLRLIGGDTVSGPLSITVQIMGELPQGEGLLRSGARPGDAIYVSGGLGDAAAGLAVAQNRISATKQDSDWLIGRLNRPTPRCELGSALRGIASAAIDISDGLLADLGHILEQSCVGAEIDLAALPTSEALRRTVNDDSQRQELQLSGGDDYELCFTVPMEQILLLDRLSATNGVSLSRIGTISHQQGVVARSLTDGEALNLLARRVGFDHFIS